jgi:Predicted ATPase with chaperone activity
MPFTCLFLPLLSYLSSFVFLCGEIFGILKVILLSIDSGGRLMVVSIRSLGLNGIAGYEVSAECFLSGGLPAFDIVGLPDAAVREARERVRAAVKTAA